MSQAKHTPGPWLVGTYLNKQAVLDEHSGVIATQVPEAADAALIAAAPDLLTLLIEALPTVACHSADHTIAARIRAAIAKATGGAA